MVDLLPEDNIQCYQVLLDDNDLNTIHIFLVHFLFKIKF